MDKVYIGTRTLTKCDVVVVSGGKRASLKPRADLWNHSPTGFEWGYGGSGPAQLALALLADHLDGKDEDAVAMHQEFKFGVVARLDKDTWTLTTANIDHWLTARGKEAA